MIIRKFTRIILGAALGISVFAFAGNVPETAYAADMSDISVTSTREDVQQVVDDGNRAGRYRDRSHIRVV